MSGRRASKPPAGSHVFPFLAVLICTMGALVTLLVVIARQAAVHAGHSSRAGQHAQRTGEARAELQRRQGALRDSRLRADNLLAERRNQLSHVEDHLRRLRDQLNGLRNADKELARVGTVKEIAEAEQLEELAKLEKSQAAARHDLALAQSQAAHRKARYAIIPYEGRSHTHRRPIYIECLANAVIVQPEGILLTDADFDGPMGPSQPLAATLRAIEEYLVKQTPAGNEKDAPYPLLLVRPDGIAAYYAARAALAAWGSEFGYELVEQDWDLEYPPPDAQLGRLMTDVVAEARIRQKALIAAAPRQYNSSRGSLRATPYRGGFGPEGGAGGSDDSVFGSVSGGRRGTAGGDSLSGSDSGGGYGSASSGDSVLGSAAPSYGESMSRGGGGSVPSTGGGGNSGSFGSSDSSGASGERGFGSTSPTVSGSASGGSAPGGGGATPDGSSTPGYTADVVARPSTPPPGRAESGGLRPGIDSLSKSRGRDWGLPGASHASFPVSRPIFIRCYPDRVVILADESATSGKNIPMTERTEDSVDDLVSEVWQHMKSWGIAGRGMHWRPTLVFSVQPGAVDRYADLKALLADSGLDVREKSTQPTVAKRPTANRKR